MLMDWARFAQLVVDVLLLTRVVLDWAALPGFLVAWSLHVRAVQVFESPGFTLYSCDSS